MARIRILIADDHALVRDSIRALLALNDDFEVVGEAGDGQAAIEACRRLNPNVVLMDINMPGLGGLEATLTIKKEQPRIKILVLMRDTGDRLSIVRASPTFPSPMCDNRDHGVYIRLHHQTTPLDGPVQHRATVNRGFAQTHETQAGTMVAGHCPHVSRCLQAFGRTADRRKSGGIGLPRMTTGLRWIP